MPKTVQIPDIDDDIYEAIQRRAVEEGMSVSEYLHQLVARAAKRPTTTDWTWHARGRRSEVTREEILLELDAIRGPRSDDEN